MIRWLAGAFVILGCGYLGVSYAGTVTNRIRRLTLLEQMLCQLEFNIVFLLQPFPMALKSVSGSYPGIMSKLFSLVGERMEKNPEISPENAFRWATEEAAVRFQAEEQSILLEFFRHIGRGNKENTRDGIRMAMAKVRTLREILEKEQEKDGKLWRSMGFLGGILIVLLVM